MNALTLLKKDHKAVKRMLVKAENTKSETQRKKLFEQLRAALETHMHIEESVFYPAIARTDKLKEMVLESAEEHKQIKTLLREMESLTEDSERFQPKLRLLTENVEHHAIEEEEEKMFPLVRTLLSSETLAQLGEDLETAKTEGMRKSA